jgi:hypothetical protein
MTEKQMTDAEYRDYCDGSRVGAAEYRADMSYRPELGSDAWRQGYCDGWTAAGEPVDQALPGVA